MFKKSCIIAYILPLGDTRGRQCEIEPKQ